ncbi:short-chain dehydrogenase/reductase sdr [Paenibacillus sabinae T27]|uniref:Short-chain dehydrogenase/reductase sdr n=1 Tax=Paenibacillus sabinae T27 TaxID=1268072 RepID=X4ZTY8_9BACL|nr:short-chain dehydrogenase/reductase sdr [Paenibacillus sabinae T27]
MAASARVSEAWGSRSTKGAIVSFTRSLTLSLVDQGIRVNSFAPSPVWTPLIPSTCVSIPHRKPRPDEIPFLQFIDNRGGVILNADLAFAVLVHHKAVQPDTELPRSPSRGNHRRWAGIGVLQAGLRIDFIRIGVSRRQRPDFLRKLRRIHQPLARVRLQAPRASNHN